jgi:hypothetical protein
MGRRAWEGGAEWPARAHGLANYTAWVYPGAPDDGRLRLVMTGDDPVNAIDPGVMKIHGCLRIHPDYAPFYGVLSRG